MDFFHSRLLFLCMNVFIALQKQQVFPTVASKISVNPRLTRDAETAIISVRHCFKV